MGEKNSTKKLVWYVLFALVTVVCCYLFVVVFFYFIYPYNISLKLAFWPFVSEEQVGQMYSEATVKVTFKYQNDEFEDIEVSKYEPNSNSLIKHMNKKEENSMTFVPTYLKRTEAEENYDKRN